MVVVEVQRLLRREMDRLELEFEGQIQEDDDALSFYNAPPPKTTTTHNNKPSVFGATHYASGDSGFEGSMTRE